MKKPNFLDQLIDKASEVSGNDSRLAMELNVTRQMVSNWRRGYKTCPAADVALMANIAGLDAAAWASRALVAKYEGTPKGEKLAVALEKALRVTGAVIVSAGANASEALS